MVKTCKMCRGILVMAAVVWMAGSQAGCTRKFYRKQADKEVNAVLREKDIFDRWKIEGMYVYPHPMARHADPTNPDRPPMPPDDAAALLLGPNPQKPGHKGPQRIEETGYFELLATWDQQNRLERAAKEGGDVKLAVASRDVPRGHRGDWTPYDPDAGVARSKPYLLRIEQAMELGLINSREFQSRREDLYLSALPVTRERFGFAAQFLALEQNVRERTGQAFGVGAGDRWQYASTAGMSKLFSTGALLLVGFANQTVLELGGGAVNKRVTNTSGINLDFIQPLLRGGGKAVTLEPLTLAERNLLYDIRNYARFRKEYFQYLIGGGDFSIAPGSVTAAGSLAASHPLTGTLQGANPGRQQVVPAGLGSVGGSAVPGTLFLQINPVGVSEGFLPALYKSSIVKYEEANVKALSDILALFDSYKEGGQVSSLQVDQVNQQLLQGRSSLLAREQDKQTSLDLFRAQLGIPINVPLELDDFTVAPLTEQIAEYSDALEDYKVTVKEINGLYVKVAPAQMRAALEKIAFASPLTKTTPLFQKRFPAEWKLWRSYDDETIVKKLREEGFRKRDLLNRRTDVGARPRTPEQQKELNDVQEKLNAVESKMAAGRLEESLRKYKDAPWLKLKEEHQKKQVQATLWHKLYNAFLDVLLDANNERYETLRPRWAGPSPAVIDGVNVVDADLEAAYELATQAALEKRFDLMNARAQVVDGWRQLRVFANGLMGVFNLAYHMDSSTPPGASAPFAFNSSRTRHQLVMNFEMPLVRLTERNAYRASLIAYQRSRRDLQQKEDQIVAQVRADIRQLQVLRQNLKIQQQALELAYRRVESSYEIFTAPTVPDNSPNAAANAAALTNQLLQAYAQLPQAQEQVLKTWIDYQIARQQLFVDIEVMPLDARGVWIDEFANRTSDRQFPQRQRQLPAGKTNP
ncbi:MAG: TolC family protein [Planctomycetes bacterium]|nr:TolC family protein [Planctomycetota bacterium]